MMELDIEEIGKVYGGTSADTFMDYAEYLDTLYAKYNCKGKGLKFLKTQCTPAEKAKIRELWNRVMRDVE